MIRGMPDRDPADRVVLLAVGARPLRCMMPQATCLKWAIASRAMPRLDVPARRHAERAPISQHRRLALIHRFLTDKRIELRTRVAGCLLLLYAQPVSRLARLTLDDIITGDDGQVFIRLGDPPTPVPEPFAAMLTELAANRVNMNTAANPGCQWLFPGQRVGQPLMPIGLRRQLHELGIPLTQARTAAFRQLVLRPRLRSSPAPSASTTAPPPNTPSQQAAPGTATRPRAGTAPWRLCTPAGEGRLDQPSDRCAPRGR